MYDGILQLHYYSNMGLIARYGFEELLPLLAEYPDLVDCWAEQRALRFGGPPGRDNGSDTTARYLQDSATIGLRTEPSVYQDEFSLSDAESSIEAAERHYRMKTLQDNPPPTSNANEPPSENDQKAGYISPEIPGSSRRRDDQVTPTRKLKLQQEMVNAGYPEPTRTSSWSRTRRDDAAPISLVDVQHRTSKPAVAPAVQDEGQPQAVTYRADEIYIGDNGDVNDHDLNEFLSMFTSLTEEELRALEDTDDP